MLTIEDLKEQQQQLNEQRKTIINNRIELEEQLAKVKEFEFQLAGALTIVGQQIDRCSQHKTESPEVTTLPETDVLEA